MINFEKYSYIIIDYDGVVLDSHKLKVKLLPKHLKMNLQILF